MGVGLLMAAHILCPHFLLTWKVTRKNYRLAVEQSLVFYGEWASPHSQPPCHLKDSYENI